MKDDYTNPIQRLADCMSQIDKAAETEEEKHILAVTEDEESYTIEFAKVHNAEETNEEPLEDEKEEAEHISFKSDLKYYEEDEEEKGQFEGYGSIFKNTDLGNDVMVAGAFSKSLKKTGPKGVKLLYQHKSDMPIGVFEEIEEDEKGLRVKGRLALGTQAGREAYELLKMGALDGLSIGFRVAPKGQEYDPKSNKRYIKEVELMEVSLVTFPMNPKARVRSVKSEERTIREWESGLRDAFNLSRSEAKVAAKAVHETFGQRDADVATVTAVRTLTDKLKHL